MIEFIVKVNDKEFVFDDIKIALDLVEATYETCRVIFCESDWETGIAINNSVDWSQLCDMY